MGTGLGICVLTFLQIIFFPTLRMITYSALQQMVWEPVRCRIFFPGNENPVHFAHFKRKATLLLYIWLFIRRQGDPGIVLGTGGETAMGKKI